jgi:hypothetical protein
MKDNGSLQKLATVFSDLLKKSLPDNFTVQAAQLIWLKGFISAQLPAGIKWISMPELITHPEYCKALSDDRGDDKGKSK